MMEMKNRFQEAIQNVQRQRHLACLLYTSDAADEVFLL